MVKHGLSVLVQQHLIHWYTSPEDHLTSYEANTAAAYSLVRFGKYIKVAEAQAGGFAGKVISNLLLLGHARVGDLVEAYQLGQSKSTHDCLTTTCRSPNKLISCPSAYAGGSNGGESAALESIYGTLYDLLRTELLSRVHVSHFHSDADNRSEAEKEVRQPEEYKAKSKKEKDAQREAAVKRKLKEWRYCTIRGNDEVAGLKTGKKRLQQDPDVQRPEKRQRLYSPSSQGATGARGRINRPLPRESGDLDVRKSVFLEEGLVNSLVVEQSHPSGQSC